MSSELQISKTTAYGYDSGTDQGACGKPYRSSRAYQPPCDLARESYCTTAGISYPWHAVRRFVRENQGLMRRMYGDQRHISVLKAELDEHDYYDHTNEIYNNPEPDQFKSRYMKGETVDNNLYPKEESAPRLLHDDYKLGEILNTKFVYSEEPSFKPKVTTIQNLSRLKSTTDKSAVANSTSSVNISVDNATEGATPTVEVDTEASVEDDEGTTIDFTTEYLTSTEKVTEATSTETVQKKETTGEVLFQDMEEQSKKPQVNYKLKGVNACPVKEEVVAPFWANNTRGEVLALLNLYPFEQYVHWEKCTYEHRQMYCREGCRCEQQYRLHRLLAYDPNNECRGIFSDWFKFPSCCVCKCYNIPPDFRVTSRSPRHRDKSSKDSKDMPSWFKRKN